MNVKPKNNIEAFDTKKFLTHAMAKLDEETIFCLVKQGLEKGIDSFTLLEEARAGMQKVGELYHSGKYFLADLIVASEIFQDMLQLILHSETTPAGSDLPPVVFGTVEEDIHDIGKNITIAVLRSKGIKVIDLGVNVPAQQFTDAVRQSGSPIVCLSGLITAAYDSMRKTVNLLDNEGLRPDVTVIIGGLVNEAVKRYTGADHFVTDCAVGSDFCASILKTQRVKSAINI